MNLSWEFGGEVECEDEGIDEKDCRTCQRGVSEITVSANWLFTTQFAPIVNLIPKIRHEVIDILWTNVTNES